MTDQIRVDKCNECFCVQLFTEKFFLFFKSGKVASFTNHCSTLLWSARDCYRLPIRWPLYIMYKSATSNLSVVSETISKTANHQTNHPILVVVPVFPCCPYSELSITSDLKGVK